MIPFRGRGLKGAGGEGSLFRVAALQASDESPRRRVLGYDRVMSPDETLDLFPEKTKRRLEPHAPLAERMRPRRLEDLVGHETQLAPGRPLHTLFSQGALPSLLLWGPPGSGKTTLAWILGDMRNARLTPLSAVTAGVADIRKAVEVARRTQLQTILFLDEIHRLNKAQQDALLPHVEAGVVTLIGATTENPSFSVIPPLLSRCRVITLEALDADAIGRVLDRALGDSERGLGASKLALSSEAREALILASQGDARRALGILEACAALHLSSRRRAEPISRDTVREAGGRIALRHDRDGEEHFNVVSALIKSLRASDPDAALHYLARLLEAGEDALYVSRRLVIFASEDVGNADPHALGLAVSSHQAVERIGMPEGRIPLAQVVTYLACAPKSNATYVALGRAVDDLEGRGPMPVPMHLRNAPTKLMKELGYGENYVYPHDVEDAFVAQDNLPEPLLGRRYYEPGEVGAEAETALRLRGWRARRARESDSDSK
jgi:putative ATPase